MTTNLHLIPSLLNVAMILGPVTFFVAYVVRRSFRHGRPRPAYLEKTNGTSFRPLPRRDGR